MPMNPRLLRPLATGFNPLTIASLEGWWDASDLSTMAQNSDGTTAVTATSDPVGYWADKSGQGRHAKQTTNNNRPQVQIADKNGRSGLNFDGSNDSYVCDSGATFAAVYVTAVVRRTGVPTDWSAIYMHLFGESPQSFQFRQTSNRVGFFHGLTVAGGLARLNGATITTELAFSRYDANLLPNTTDTNVIGLQGDQSSTVGTQIPRIGLDPTVSNRCYPMRLYEIMVFSAIPATAQLRALERHLGRKWGIAVA